jgi:hypothetical protein
VPSDSRIDELSEAVQLLATAICRLADALSANPDTAEDAVIARRIASGAERVTERILLHH